MIEARPKRQTMEAMGSTTPSWNVMAYQVVPQIRAQTATLAMARLLAEGLKGVAGVWEFKAGSRTSGRRRMNGGAP